ncbi:hypothetical protein [Paenibacillus sp. DMB20]|uniref:hypothetical protein n=1 Tax=Paenibacillus sp. DMB20 TaxID=1642570 RepID=UPI00062762ED|nr:hypothetical protein [Paenibacillus sp. DMB20]KKO53912.1 hypothetical protein XI25_09985 [Paenibacillus sp. DMB20]
MGTDHRAASAVSLSGESHGNRRESRRYPSSIWVPLPILAAFTVTGLLLAAFTFRWDNDVPAGPKKHRIQEASSA